MKDLSSTHTGQLLFIHHLVLALLTIAISVMWVKMALLKRRIKKLEEEKD